MNTKEIGEFLSLLRKEHISAMVVVPLFAIVVLFAGLLLEDCFYLSIIALTLGFGWNIFQYNRMMIYVEQHAFDGTGKE